jgi:hypothetical protein
MATPKPLSNPERRAWQALLISCAITVGLYVVPFGGILAYPLVLLSTLAHEMGHGLTAVLVGGDFESFQLFADGSGVAQWSGNPSRLDRAFVSAGGLLGPAVVAAVLFFVGKWAKVARVALTVLGAALIIALVLVIRNMFGLAFVSLIAALCLWIGIKGSARAAQIAVVFVGVQLALSVFSRGDYLFTDTAMTASGPMPSDVAQISEALFGPYWLWGGLCGAVSVGVLLGGLWMYLRGAKRG